MFCSTCGCQNDDGAAFCKGCGSPLSDADYVEVQSTPVEPKSANSTSNKTKRSGLGSFFITLLVIVLARAAGYVIGDYWGSSSKKSDSSQRVQSTTESELQESIDKVRLATFKRGNITGDTYTNNTVMIKFKLPDGWTTFEDDVLKSMSSEGITDLNEESLKDFFVQNKGGVYADFGAENEEGEIWIKVIYLTDEDKATDYKSFLEEVHNSLMDNKDSNTEIQNYTISEGEIASHECGIADYDVYDNEYEVSLPARLYYFKYYNYGCAIRLLGNDKSMISDLESRITSPLAAEINTESIE